MNHFHSISTPRFLFLDLHNHSVPAHAKPRYHAQEMGPVAERTAWLVL